MAKSIKTRIQNKHDTEANWKLATSFMPLAGEVIIYDPDATHERPRVKIGDGKTLVNQLDFVHADFVAGSNITITPDATNDKITISAALDDVISTGTADPTADTTSQFYFKYSTN
jgi:hypothetical protein